MWLIDTNTLQLKEFTDEREIRYAILSHRWEKDEVSFKDMMQSTHGRSKAGFWKIKMCCAEAAESGLPYAWVDTCCIDKSSSAELQEAINSMFRWYRNAAICYAFLSDVSGDNPDELGKSLWFTRGWTLQELVAPREVRFYSKTWAYIGSKTNLCADLTTITNIPISILFGTGDIFRQCVAERMSWAHGRATARIEDRAYSLMGLFDVNMPMLYGEGEKAFQRLQEEIFRRSNDQSILAWTGIQHNSFRLFARSPDDFPLICAAKTWNFGQWQNTSKFKSEACRISDVEANPFFERRNAALLTNEGIEMEVGLVPWKPRVYLAFLNYSAGPRSWPLSATECIFVKRIGNMQRFARVQDILYGDLVTPNLSEQRTLVGPLIEHPRLNAALSGVRRVEKVILVQSLLNRDEEMTLEEDPYPGYQITRSDISFVKTYGHLDRTKSIVTLKPGRLGPVAILSFTYEGFAFRVLLGFDLDYQATIVIQGNSYFGLEQHPAQGNTNNVAWKQLESITCIETEGWIPVKELRLHKVRMLNQVNLPFKLGPASLEYSNFYFSIHSDVLTVEAGLRFRLSIQRLILEEPFRVVLDLAPSSNIGPWHESFSKVSPEERDRGEHGHYRLELNH